ncbi:hypothetical protein AAHE18_17G163800 [Arachis hypogaea]|nr:uncharacterized protein DS421_17g590480 [Arachis hypogaea]
MAMGCNGSKVERLPAVSLCRDRCNLLDDALFQSYALSDAHMAHMHSLKTLSSAIVLFFQQHYSPPPPPTLTPINGCDGASKKSSSSSSDDSESRVLLHSESDAQDIDDSQTELFITVSRHDEYLNYHTYDNVAFMHYVLQSPPPLPSPPSTSRWEFFNFFEPYDDTYCATADVATKEEKEDTDRGKVATRHESLNEAKKVNVEQNEGVENKEAGLTEECSGYSERVKEIQILFERASDSGNPLLEMLDVGKFRYHKKLDFHYSYIVSSCKIKNLFTHSLNCTEKSSLIGRTMASEHQAQATDKDWGHGYGNLCSTLKKLSVWERKLYHEVKTEEKLRILHQKNCRELRRMNKKGADAQKVDSVKTLIGMLTTKMNISIRVVDRISNTISKLREEELWPQINNFIHMFLEMWKHMAECHRRQYQEIVKSKTLDASTLLEKQFDQAQIDAVIKLKCELQNWNISFSDWIQAQKCYVKALNSWLVRFLLYGPEELPDDDTTTFSPSKIDAPPVFVICNKWSQAMDNLSEKNVTEAVNGFIVRLNELLEKHIIDVRQRLILDKELERKVKIMEKQEQKMHKIVQARQRKMAAIGREEENETLFRVDHGDLVDIKDHSLLSSMKHIFASMERFTATNAGLYQDLCQQINHVLGQSNEIH